MYTPANAWGTDLKRDPQACKVRLARIYKTSGQSMMQIMEELKTLTEKDLEDFRTWFAAAGYPCT